ncbi:atherin-like [Canis lupus dingo]|uniref:atherin-like n=1 Tax=Canis lupus dingo TaxID=286419 RepID=UPI000BAA1782|nr:atherin-like [Canis lupus dingo]|eukprot:XP_022279612.1 atherin-like [Canis lupus familiaris]
MERASERASAGDTGRRDSSASAGCGCGGEGPLRPGAPPGGARRATPAGRQEARPPPPPPPPPPQSWLLAAAAVSAPPSAEAAAPGPSGSQTCGDCTRHCGRREQTGAGPRSGRGSGLLTGFPMQPLQFYKENGWELSLWLPLY